MFTIKFYGGHRQKILSADSFTILRGGDDGGAEITLHQKNNADDIRIDIVPENTVRSEFAPPVYQRAIIENAAGRTTEIIDLGNLPPAARGLKAA